MDRKTGFVLVVMAMVIQRDREKQRTIGPATIAYAVENITTIPDSIPGERDLYSLALEYVEWQYGTGPQPDWLK